MAAPILHMQQNKEYTINQYLTDHLLIIGSDGLGGSEDFTNELETGLTHYYKTTEGVKHLGLTNWSADDLCFYTGASKTAESIKVYRYKTTFTPTEAHGATVFYKCILHPNEGGQINILEGPGDVINSEEIHYLLGIQQTNRTYGIPHSSEIAENFLANNIPAGLSPKLFNFAPQVSAQVGDSRWYSPATGDNEILLSGLIVDPENDILTYKWSQIFPTEEALTGLELMGEFADDTALETTFTIQPGETPPVDTAYTFKLTVSDSNNSVSDTIDVLVSGLDTFDLFSDTGFGFSDINLTFDSLDN